MTAAFSASEQAKILMTHLDNPNNPFYGTAGGNATDDKVYLLGLDDVYGENSNYSAGHWYFNNDTDRQASVTWYAVKRGVSSYNRDDFGLHIVKPCNTISYDINKCVGAWWLRSPGFDTERAANVSPEGLVIHGNWVYRDDLGVRPALWVNY